MKAKLNLFAVLFVVAMVGVLFAVPIDANAGGPPPRDDDGNRVRVTVYVESQGLFYESIVGPDLPMKGKFQQLFPPFTNPDHPSLDRLSTEFGPGNPGYLGGRWWVDVNETGEMDEGDHFFSCPLLGKGSATPPA